jgi:predicted aspartyl protease
MFETQQGFYSDRNEPIVHVELIGRSDVSKEHHPFLVDSGFNGSMLVPISLVKAMGWQITDVKDSVAYGGGKADDIVKAFGYVRFNGNLRQIDVLANTSKVTANNTKSEIVGYIGMGLLKDTSINFGKHDFNITTYEG